MMAKPTVKGSNISNEQWPKLAAQLRRARRSKYYQSRVAVSLMQPNRLMADFQSLPLTTKTDLVENNLDFLAVNPCEIREWVTTSGTTGHPVRMALSQPDLRRLADNEAAALSLAGLRPGDGLLIAVGMDRLFVAGLAYWLGAQAIGVQCLRVGPSLVDMKGVRDLPFQPGRKWFLIGVPSLLYRALKDGAPLPADLGAIIGIGESLYDADFRPNSIHRALAEFTTAPILSTYASTEVCSTFAQGPKCYGNHLNPDLAIVEILDDRGRTCPPGVPGRVVITPLGQHAMPLIRFDTGDVAAIHLSSCPCGRRTPRLGPILGRYAQLLKVQGVSIFPTAIIDLVREVYADLDAVIHANCDPIGADQVTIHIVCPARRRSVLKAQFSAEARRRFKWIPEIRYCNLDALARIRALHPSRKLQPFIDARSAADISPSDVGCAFGK